MKQINQRSIEQMIYLVRGERVILDSDLATLYEVTTGNLNKAVSRNCERFPNDFMFELTKKEFGQIKDFSGKHGGRRTLPRVFTESGVAMLSGVLNSKRAVDVNISIMRTFIKLRKALLSDESIAEKLSNLEKGTNKLFRIVFERLDKLEVETPNLSPRRKKIGLKS